jgi:hypothetical protein
VTIDESRETVEMTPLELDILDVTKQPLQEHLSLGRIYKDFVVLNRRYLLLGLVDAVVHR